MTGRIYQLQYQALAEPFSSALAEIVTVDKWFVISNEPRWDKKKQQWSYPSFFYDHTQPVPTMEGWYRETSRPRWDIKRQQWLYPTFAVDASQLTQSENITLDKWFKETDKPRWDAKRHQWLYPSWAVGVFEEEPVEEVSVDSWYQNTNTPRFDKPRRQWLYPSWAVSTITPISAITLEGPLVIIFKKLRYQYQSLAQPLPDRFGNFPSGPQDLTLSPFMLGTTELRAEMSSREYNAFVSALELQPIVSTDQVVS